ncbi:Peptidyl-tRNA hydrolase PTH2 [Trinorchestia longiramus]|nr:Peptidyl-tRNA hydrolase PTH2 [Trinorchestia longiramus]
MDTPSVNSKNSVEQVNETSAMDVDNLELNNFSSESNDQSSKNASDKLGSFSQSESSNVTTPNNSNECASPSSESITAVTECISASCDGATSLVDGATASGSSSSASACDTSAPEIKETFKSHGANPVLLSQLLEMGVPANLAIRALLFSGNTSVEGAFTWLADLSAEEADALSLRSLEDDAHDWEDVDDDDENEAFSHKMALVVDSSLRMKPGKTAAQVGHAVLGLYRVLQRATPRQRASSLSKWEITGEKMVVLRASDANQLRLLKRKADAVKLFSYMVADAGLTQIAPGSVTVLAVFGTSKEVDLITGDLKLL